jgi:colanic acid/amylovoran biosynthesis glycosyltransferase
MSLAVDRLRSLFRASVLRRHGNMHLSFMNSLVEAERFNIVHMHSGPSFFWDSLQGISVPKVVSFYGSDILRNHRRKYMKRLKRLVHRPYTFVVTSYALSEALKGLGAPNDRIHVIPVGIDLRNFPEQGLITEWRHEHRDCDVSILTVGRLIDFKAPQMLPQVARILRDRGLGFKWTLVGDGPLKGLVSRNVAKFGVEDCFQFVGSLPFDEVCKLMKDADLMVHNAVVAPDGGREALGVVLIEAAAMGLPVVSCRVGGIPEVVLNGETGLLVEQGDLEGMANNALRLAQNRELRIQMGMKAMRHARTVFDTARLSELMEDLYDTLIKEA